MVALLASVDQLAARLGVALMEGTPDFSRAVGALEDASIRARSVASQPGWDADNVPEDVWVVVLHAARRIYTNPDRFLSNMAGGLQAALSSNEFNGDIFMAGELATLRKFRPNAGLMVVETTRCGGGPVLGHYVSDGNGGDDILLGGP